MEMEMRAREDIKAGQDLTTPLPPLTFALHHQSPTSSDIRAALRLLPSLPSTSTSPPPRLFGLLTNRDRLMSSPDPDVLSMIREGAREMSTHGRPNLYNDDVALEEALLCLVMTNAVEVQDNNGRMLGIAVYDHNFSWINHSCSPNASYRFFFSHSNTPSFSNHSNMLIVPAFFNDVQTQGKSDVCSTSQLKQGCERYGPSIIVRSIKRINKGEAVTVPYTDLLQPKAMRQAELWSKYQFVCCCKRCTASPPTYVDRTLEEISAYSLELNSRFDHHFNRDEANQKLTDYMDEVVTEYLSVGDPESCCKKMEHLLNQGLLCELSETGEGKVVLNLRLHPLHHLALNAYTTLASAYKIRSNDLLALNSDNDAHNLEAFNMSRTSAGYSLLLAGATDYLFQSESSLIASAANFWESAGESLLTLARSSGWNLFVKPGKPVSNSSLKTHKCSKCSLMDRLEVNGPAENADFGNISCKFLDCISNMTRKVWNSITYSCAHLQTYKDPINFSRLSKSSNLWDLQAHCGSIDEGSHFGSEGSISRIEAQVYTEEVKVSIFQLGVHCLAYGGYLANICYGKNSHLT
ncbi:hypothetical protein Q3G72_028937 [Acer saccharum]|nr:hypothetical protein Q3G72_028937 [Acer saccharum]